MKKILTYIFRAFKWTSILIGLYLLLAFILSFIPTFPKKLNCTKNKELFISTNGVHLDIIIPDELLNKKLREELKLAPSVQFVSFGWGDKGFYLETPTWNKLKFSTAFKAMFLKSETAVHLTRYYRTLEDWKKLELCESQLETILSHIEQSFKRNENGEIMEINNSGYSKHDIFYEANGNYSCFNTCNYWVNTALKKAQVRTSIWSPFDFGVLHFIPSSN